MIKTDFVNITDDTLLSKALKILKGIIIGYIIALVFLFITACVITYTMVSDAYLSGIVSVITVVSIIISGMNVSKNFRTKGWLYGTITGITYTTILYIFGLIFLSDIGTQKSFLISCIIGIFCGALGGIIGINMKK